MTPGSGILTSLMNDFSSVFVNGLGFISGDAKYLLGTLILLDFMLATLLSLGDDGIFKTWLKKLLFYGIFIYLVLNWRMLVNAMLGSFVKLGLKAGGGSVTEGLISDPSSISDFGLTVSQPIFTHISNYGALDVLPNLPDIIFTGLTGLLIVFCFFFIGIQIFVTYLEFYIFATLGLILIPWGTFKYTAWLAEKTIGAIIGYGIKLMVLSFICSAFMPLIQKWSLPPDPTIEQCLYVLLGALSVTFLAWHAPAVAGGMLSGAPSLSAGTAVSTGAAAYTGVVAGASMAKEMGSGTVNAAVNATKAAASMTGGSGAANAAASMAGATLAQASNSGIAAAPAEGVNMAPGTKQTGAGSTSAPGWAQNLVK